MLRYSCSILFIQHICNASALVSPQGMIQYLYKLQQVLNAVFYSLPSFMQMQLYPPFQSSFVKNLALLSLLFSFANSSVLYLSLIITLFSLQQFTTSYSLLSFLRTNSTKALALKVNSLIKPFLRFLLMYSFSTANSFFAI